MKFLCRASSCVVIILFLLLNGRFEWVGGCLEDERGALLLLQRDLDLYDETWKGEDCCQWFGIECSNSTPRVVGIDLQRMNMSRFANYTLFAVFKDLQYLTLSQNEGMTRADQMLNVTCELKHLRVLDLSYNSIDSSIPPCLCGNQKLEYMDLSNNRLKGSIPFCLGNMKSLQYLDLSHNQLIGSIPSCLGDMKSLHNLSLSDNKLTGSIPSFQGNMESLVILDLSDNQLIGSIPSFQGNMESLQNLDLSRNQLTGSIPSFQGNMESLQNLDLSDNQLRGSIPSFQGNMESLDLNLSYNQLTGSIPSFQGIIKSLESLDLSHNQLTGSIPSFQGNRESLVNLDLSYNQLTGNIPSLQGIMKSLQNLDLSHNQLTGSIPPFQGNRESLENLNLSYNQLTGNIPPMFSNLTMTNSIDISNNRLSGKFSFSALANISDLIHVDLSNNVQLEVDTESPSWVPSFSLRSLILANCILNKQTSSIPSFISSQDLLYELDLSHSSLEGKIPDWLLYNMSFYYYLKATLRGNKLIGPLPSPVVQNLSVRVTWLDISDNQFSGPLSANIDFFASTSRLQFLNMSSNALDGEIPKSMISIKGGLRALDLSNNDLSREIPHWLAANNSMLQVLILSNNKFQGNMLPEDSNMTNLSVLRLDGNNFTGSIPASLVNSPSLKILDVGENNLAGDISNLLPMPSQLSVLFFGHNNLQGHIPRHLCLLRELHYLDLSENLLSGDIPLCFFNITSMAKENSTSFRSYWNKFLIVEIDKLAIDIVMEIHFNTKGASYIFKGKPVVVMNGIDLSFNQLTGSIPTEIGYLKGLRSLNLSHNSLIGHIPTSFQYLESLECLDLSYNHINGTIPLEMARLDSLAVLNVSFNNLSGEIPSDGHFLTLNDPTSYMGNPNLCGRELEKHCSSDNGTPSISHGGEEKSSIMDRSFPFYLSVAISYILGFWGVIALLIFKKNWRYKFFKSADVSLERCCDKLCAIQFYLKNRFQSR